MCNGDYIPFHSHSSQSHIYSTTTALFIYTTQTEHIQDVQNRHKETIDGKTPSLMHDTLCKGSFVRKDAAKKPKNVCDGVRLS